MVVTGAFGIGVVRRDGLAAAFIMLRITLNDTCFSIGGLASFWAAAAGLTVGTLKVLLLAARPWKNGLSFAGVGLT